MVTEEAEKEHEDTASSTCATDATDDCSTHIRIPCHPAAAAEDDDAYFTKTRTRDNVPINVQSVFLPTNRPIQYVTHPIIQNVHMYSINHV